MAISGARSQPAIVKGLHQPGPVRVATCFDGANLGVTNQAGNPLLQF
jgi:hypothetical protein